jgi:outer membrane receptor protein involved in Fe transport
VRLRVALGLIAEGVTASAKVAAQTEPLEEVNVRGSKTGDFSSRSDEQTSAREVTDAASLVEPLPGVHLRRYGGDDSFATLSIRGSSSTEVAIVFAGVPLNGGADPSLDLSSLPLWPGASATVHRTFTPAALGAGSLGGTLVLDPPRASSPPRTVAWAAVGSFGEARLRVADLRAVGNGRLVAALSASRADDDFSYLDPLVGSPGHDAYATWQNAGHAAVDGLVAWAQPVRWSKDMPGALTVTALAQARHQELPGTVLGPTPFAALDSDRELVAAELTGAAGPGAWSVRAWGRREGLRLTDADASAALGPTRADQTIAATGGALGWRGQPTHNLTFEAHTDGSGECFVPGVTQGALPPPGAVRGALGGGIDTEWRALDRLRLGASGRLDSWTNVSAGTTTGAILPTGHIGIEVPLDFVTLTAHGGATARPPSFVELYGDRGAFIGDPALLPESAWTLDAGARAAHHHGELTLAAEVDGFATWATDLITFVPTGAYGRAQATNIGQARLAGVEADVRAGAGPFELRLAYTGLLTENDSACKPIVGPCQHPELPGRPVHDFVGDLIAHAGPVTLRAGLDAVAGMVADVAGSIGVPPRGLVSAGIHGDVLRDVRLGLDVRNLLDVRTGTYAGALGPVHEPIGDYYEYPLPGRSFLATARFER